ncbi:hypothetical protein G9465_20935 (plasmid) [Haloarcula sp. JP-L23]|nr:hypothetical protein G9465_20935 [Haloarcula sp. JP-L23]
MLAKQCWLDSTVVDETSQFELYEAFNPSFDAIVLSVDTVDTYELPASIARIVPYDYSGSTQRAKATVFHQLGDLLGVLERSEQCELTSVGLPDRGR